MPPPSHLKKDKDRNAHESLGVAIPPGTTGRNTPLRKIWEHGIPPQPLADFPLPHPGTLLGTVRGRVSILVQSITGEVFVSKLKSSSMFDVRSHHLRENGNSDLHFGEIYAYGAPTQHSCNGQTSNGHAWIMLTASPSLGVYMVSQWHHCHGSPSIKDELPTYLYSLENYLMYVHMRLGVILPHGIVQ